MYVQMHWTGKQDSEGPGISISSFNVLLLKMIFLSNDNLLYIQQLDFKKQKHDQYFQKKSVIDMEEKYI